ncbi:protein Mpv17 [Anabrus simplex]|uniref:protein Mpv17 n=1 Tax=Anabrus simplex TaxID=316456 RepID=UPI0034DD0384
MKILFRAYQEVLRRHPFGVQAIQTGLLMGAGDIIAQTAIEKKTFRELDRQRLIGYSALGLCVLGPSLRLWYGLLDRFFPTTGKKLAYKKVLLDQLAFAPSAIAVVVSLTSAVNGSSVPQIRAKLHQDYVDILIANYKLWPAVMVINFSLVPLQYQVLVTQVVAVFWNTYFSWKANQPLQLPLPHS